eukprot:CAMPEP_0173395942 /NCGR_PEP_ID=MMETSP1356-20130122/33870_1 /TAXON_ID=77927 ORGANISM="Hemiselmis virescens, Strain PCC157" /NCGR_SAMPLE_ID=MMETSP1356 /ASSEMBLY_ACC=CAM_ASM_000847 /LENGTH=60 /DNA_ID=CAMNT_0014354821 /DNA_START=45 /DNA_END=224 /DNA_ORIENTATION=-
MKSLPPVQPPQQMLCLLRLVCNLGSEKVGNDNATARRSCHVGCCFLDLVVDAPPLLQNDQ